MTEYTSIIDSPVGKLGLIASSGALQSIAFLPDDTDLLPAVDVFSELVVSQLQSYFKEPCFVFDLPLDIIGRPFQKTVWCALRKISVGSTKTYSELSGELGSGPRAVGNACRSNPIPIVIPCHRIVAKNGLGGFAGKTAGPSLVIKQWLLSHEATLCV